MIVCNICISISGLQWRFVIFLEIFLMVLIMQEIYFIDDYTFDLLYRNDQSFIFIVYFDYSKDCKYNECNSNVLIRKETD